MAGPGTPGWAVPAGEDYLVRENAERKREIREGQASIAASFTTTVARLDAAVADVAAQAAALAAQDMVIAAQVADIAALVGQQVTLSTLSNAASNFAVGTGYGAFASIVFTVPTGYTKAAIQANGAASLYYTGAANPEEMRARMTIGSNNGGELAYLVDTSSVGARITSAAANHSTSFTGLSAGGAITVYLGLHSSAVTWPANTYNSAVVAATATFTR